MNKAFLTALALGITIVVSQGVNAQNSGTNTSVPPGIEKQGRTPGQGSHKGWEQGQHKGWDKQQTNSTTNQEMTNSETQTQ